MIKKKHTQKGIEGMFLNNKKFNICQAHIIVKGKKLKSFPIRSRTPKKKPKQNLICSQQIFYKGTKKKKEMATHSSILA